MLKNAYPILEFDAEKTAVIEPAMIIKPKNVPIRCVLTFFRDVISSLLDEGRLKVIATLGSEAGSSDLYEMDEDGRKVAVFHPWVGATLAAGFLEELIALGCRKFMVCGGAGSLVKDVTIGHLLVPHAAIRDEGVSYHYLPPSRTVAVDPQALQAIETHLQQQHVPYTKVLTWTTDAFYRETAGKVARRVEEGAATVEMECAAFFAVAQFRGVPCGQILYAGDDLSGSSWQHRDWHTKTDVRRSVFALTVQACLAMEAPPTP